MQTGITGSEILYKTPLFITALFLLSCGGEKSDTPMDVPTLAPAIDLDAQVGDEQVVTDSLVDVLPEPTAEFGFPDIFPSDNASTVDLAEFYNLYWFDPSPPEYPFGGVSIHNYSNAYVGIETTYNLNLLDDVLHQFATELFEKVELGQSVSDSEMENALAVEFHQRLNDCFDVEFTGGFLSAYTCEVNPRFFYHVPSGGKLLVELKSKSADNVQFYIGNRDIEDPGLGFGVWYAFMLAGQSTTAQYSHPGVEIIEIEGENAISSDRDKAVYLLKNVRSAILGLLSDVY